MNAPVSSQALFQRNLARAGSRLGGVIPALFARRRTYAALMRLDRPIGALLLLWPTLWGLWIANSGLPSLHLFAVFVLGVFLTRSAGCILNDLADRGFDPHVERTQNRPLASGAVGAGEALSLAAVLMCAAFALVLTTNRLTVLLSFIGIPLMAVYPYMKRYTYLPQFFLGLAFSWGIPMAFAATRDVVPEIAWLVFIANLLWVVVFDTIYAMIDRDDDLKIGVKSTAILFDDADRFFIGIFQCLFIVVLFIIGQRLKLGAPYQASLAAAVILMAYHQYLIRDRAREHCMRAFTGNNWVGAVIFCGLALEFGLR